jgi:hypothetical protein
LLLGFLWLNFNLSACQSVSQSVSQVDSQLVLVDWFGGFCRELLTSQSARQSVRQPLQIFISAVLDNSDQTAIGNLVAMAIQYNFYFRYDHFYRK